MTLTEFLLARIAEAEAAAKAALAALSDLNCQATVAGEFGAHIARHDPERVLARCEADRRIVERASVECICTDHGHNRVDACPQCVACHAVTMADGYVLADLALPFADHPDYLPEWKP